MNSPSLYSSLGEAPVLPTKEMWRTWSQIAAVTMQHDYVAGLAQREIASGTTETFHRIIQELKEIAREAADAQQRMMELCRDPAGMCDAPITAIVSDFFSYAQAFHSAKLFHRLDIFSSVEMKQFTDWIDSSHSHCEQLWGALCRILGRGHARLDEISEIVLKTLDDLSVRRLEHEVRWTPGVEALPRPGDVLFLRFEKVVFLSPPQLECREDGSIFLAGPALSVDIAREEVNQHESYTVALSDINIAMRGDSCWLLTPLAPRGAYSPHAAGVLLERRIWNECYERSELYVGQVLSVARGIVTVLWRKEGEENLSVERLEMDGNGLIEASFHHPSCDTAYLERLPVDGGAALCERSNRFLPPGVIASTPSVMKEHSVIDMRALCSGIQKAEFPILLHTFGLKHDRSGARQALEAITIQGIQEDSPLPRDAATLLAYGVSPVVVIAGADPSVPLVLSIKAMQELGLKVVIWDSEYNRIDILLQYTIRDLLAQSDSGVRIVSGDAELLVQTIRELGREAESALTAPCIREHYARPRIRRPLSAMTSRLFEISDAQLEQSGALQVQLSTDLLELCRKATTAEAAHQGALLEQAYSLQDELSAGGIRGRTRFESELAGYDFVEIAEALARSRLSPRHPAVALRGITCGDLTPKALIREFKSGAHIHTVRAPDGSIGGVAITYSPAVLESKRPGLSELLGAPGKTSYLYWAQVVPETDGSCTRVYSKLISAFLIESVLLGADIATAVILERNIPSLLAAFAVAGFTVTPHTLEIGGERAIRVVCDLRELDQVNRERSIKAAMNLSTKIFIGAHYSDTPTEVGRVRETLQHIDQLLELAAAWKEVKHVLATTERYTSFVEAVERVEGAVMSLGDLIDWRTRSESRLCLLELTHEHEDTRSRALARFEELFSQIVPKSSRELERTRTQLLQSVPELSSEFGAPVRVENRLDEQPAVYEIANTIAKPSGTERFTSESINALFSPEYRKSVWGMRHVLAGFYFLLSPQRDPGDGRTDIVRRFDQAEQYRRSRIQRTEWFREGVINFPDLDRVLQGCSLTESEASHAEQVRQLFDYAKFHLREDTYTDRVASVVMAELDRLFSLS